MGNVSRERPISTFPEGVFRKTLAWTVSEFTGRAPPQKKCPCPAGRGERPRHDDRASTTCLWWSHPGGHFATCRKVYNFLVPTSIKTNLRNRANLRLLLKVLKKRNTCAILAEYLRHKMFPPMISDDTNEKGANDKHKHPHKPTPPHTHTNKYNNYQQTQQLTPQTTSETLSIQNKRAPPRRSLSDRGFVFPNSTHIHIHSKHNNSTNHHRNTLSIQRPYPSEWPYPSE